MQKPKDLYIDLDTDIDYGAFLQEHKREVLESALAAIDPDAMRMEREQALILAGAMKNCGFSREDFAGVMARSRYDKGTFAKQWDKFRGEGKHGKATEGTIFDYAKHCGWKWPSPADFEDTAHAPAHKAPKPAQVQTIARVQEDAKLVCIMDSIGYTSKPSPADARAIRGREQVPTPAPAPMTIQEFASAISEGHSFYPTVYSKEITGHDEAGKPIYDYRPIEQQIFVVDIDNDRFKLDERGNYVTDQNGKRVKEAIDNPLTIKTALEICRQNEIAPLLICETFSSKQHRDAPEKPFMKFRIVFATDKPIKVQKEGERGINATISYFINLFGEAADPNPKDRARLIYGTDEKAHLYGSFLDHEKLLQKVYAPAPEKQPEPEPAKQEEPIVIQSGAEMIDAFLSTIQTREFEQEETGISDIDRALKGGFIRRTMVMLGAAPGLGKTLLMQWILENMAKHGHDVLYINLEMDRAQLLARSISRYAWQYERANIDALAILKGYQWDEEQRAAILRTAERYKQEIAPHFTYNPDGTTNKISRILQVIDATASKAKEEGRPAPLVCIDYLQLIDNENRDATEGLKNTITKLKDRAKDHNTIIFIITANNRESNKTGVTNLESGRDTSAIEYTGDYMLGLSYTVIEDGRLYRWTNKKLPGNKSPYRKCDLDYIRRLRRQAKDDNKPAPTVCNEISLKINKNRFGEGEERVKLYLDGEHSKFELVDRKHRSAIPDLLDEDESEFCDVELSYGGQKLTPTADELDPANFFS